MDVFTTTRTAVVHRMTWMMASLLLIFGSWLIGQGVWIHLKAFVAQRLLQQAWQETLTTQQPIKPWSWADTWPAGRLVVPRLEINQIILANASGQSLAFGPGKVGNKPISAKTKGHIILSGHRDTHFSFIRDIHIGERMKLQTLQGHWKHYVVEHLEIVDSRTKPLFAHQKTNSLQLITCYPFDAVQPGGPLRYVVTAKPDFDYQSLKQTLQQAQGEASEKLA